MSFAIFLGLDGEMGVCHGLCHRPPGRFKGSDEITLKLNRIQVAGKWFEVASSYAESKSSGEGKKTSRKIFGGAGLGAIVGALAGRGRGAAIGAAVSIR